MIRRLFPRCGPMRVTEKSASLRASRAPVSRLRPWSVLFALRRSPFRTAKIRCVRLVLRTIE
ncbi:hypothetical protein [uncultured Parabacteroides sp.]|uniref:hypothetical protein n=1 Tax=uncultured Parabacteroides sp. TaxID=512312 RepID=UPI0026EA48D3|nr:hypothetical protein [uncultured Parabacteroides sp.]